MISIIIPTFNSGKYLEEALLSVFSQKTDYKVELIIIDGVSTDDTLKILKKYENKFKNKNGFLFKWISEKDDGMYDAINKGLNLATGNVMTYLGSDDIFMPGSIQTVMSIFESKKEIKWITGWPTYINQVGLITRVYFIHGYDREFIKKGYYKTDYLHFIQQEGTFWKRELWEKLKRGINNRYKLAGDYFLSTSFSRFEKLTTLHSSLAGFRLHSEQLHSNYFSKYKKEMKDILDVKPNNIEKMTFKLYKIYNNLPVKLRKIKRFNNKMPAMGYNLKSNKWEKII
jgi:glycosyltransferase involved in cell wall biosynthesis